MEKRELFGDLQEHVTWTFSKSTSYKIAINSGSSFASLHLTRFINVASFGKFS